MVLLRSFLFMLLCNVALVVNNAVHFRDDHQYSSLLYQNANETMMKSKRQGLTDEERLLRVIMQDYDPISRPVHNASDSVLVTLGLALIQIQKMDEVNQLLTTYVWYEQSWKDERLVWDPQEYNGLKVFRVPGYRLWIPDIVLYNSARDDTDTDLKTRAMINYNGEVLYAPLGRLSSTCRIDITCYPFDHQVCKLKFGSWTYDKSQMDLFNKSDHMDMENYVESGEWDLNEVTVVRNMIEYPCCPGEYYPDVTFYLHMARRSMFYWTNIIFPCLWLTIINIATFALPPETGERVTMGITVFLSFSVFMLLVAESVPATSDSRPLLGEYLALALSLNAGSLIIAIFLHNMHHSSPFVRRAVPNWVRKIMMDRIGPIVGMSVANCERRVAVSFPENDSSNNCAPLQPEKSALLSIITGVARAAKTSPKFSLNNSESTSSLEHANANGRGNSINRKSSILRAANEESSTRTIISGPSNDSSPIGRQVRRKNTQNAATKEWKMLIHVLDRVSLIAFVTASILINVVFLLALPQRMRCYRHFEKCEHCDTK